MKDGLKDFFDNYMYIILAVMCLSVSSMAYAADVFGNPSTSDTTSSSLGANSGTSNSVSGMTSGSTSLGREENGKPLGTTVEGTAGDKNVQGNRPMDSQGNPPQDLYGNRVGAATK